MSVTEDVLVGYANIIAAAGLATFNPSGVYQVTDTALLFKILSDGATFPDRAVVLNLIPLTDDISIPQGRSMLQVVGRGLRNQPVDVDRLMDPIFDLLQGRRNDIFGQTVVDQIYRTSSIPMGEDAMVRTERADKYYLDIAYAPTSLRPAGGSW